MLKINSISAISPKYISGASNKLSFKEQSFAEAGITEKDFNDAYINIIDEAYKASGFRNLNPVSAVAGKVYDMLRYIRQNNDTNNNKIGKSASLNTLA